MQSVVTLLGGRHREAVEELTAEIDSRFVRRGFCPTPYPHLSYHVAEGYDRGALRAALARVAAETPPLVVRTAGLGIFTGEAHPVIHLPVVRGPELSELQRKLWEAAGAACTGCNPHYEPGRWMPHITLAEGELLREHLPAIVGLLWRRDFSWEIELDGLALIYDDGARQGAEMVFSLGEGRDPTK